MKGSDEADEHAKGRRKGQSGAKEDEEGRGGRRRTRRRNAKPQPEEAREEEEEAWTMDGWLLDPKHPTYVVPLHGPPDLSTPSQGQVFRPGSLLTALGPETNPQRLSTWEIRQS